MPQISLHKSPIVHVREFSKYSCQSQGLHTDNWLSIVKNLLSKLLTSLCDFLFPHLCKHLLQSNFIFANLMGVKGLPYVCISSFFVSCFQFLDQWSWEVFHTFNCISKLLFYEWHSHNPCFLIQMTLFYLMIFMRYLHIWQLDYDICYKVI